MSIATINKTIGPHSFPLQNLPTTMLPVLLLEYCLSLPTKATTQTLPSTLNMTSLLSELKTLLWTWKIFTKNFTELSSMPNSCIRPWQTPNDFQHQTSRLESSLLLKHNSLEQLILP